MRPSSVLHSPSPRTQLSGSDVQISSDYPRLEDKLILCALVVLCQIFCYFLVFILESRITAPVSVICILLVSYIAELCLLDSLVCIIIERRLGTF